MYEKIRVTTLQLYISYRPYLFSTLRTLSRYFELILFTAGTKTYAKAVASKIQQSETFFDHIISREFCIQNFQCKYFAKDLNILLEGRELKDIIIVDNRAESFAYQIKNGIPIPDYEGNKEDEELAVLTEYLLSFRNEKDVRNKIVKDFGLSKLIDKQRCRKSVSGLNRI